MSEENIIVDPETETTQPETPESPPEAVKIPDKFKGKSLEDIIEAYTGLEAELGRKGNEVGQLRNLTDQLLGLEEAKRKREAEAAKPARKITSDELFEDPDKSITERAREIAEARASQTDERVAMLEAALREEAFDKRHPGFKKTIQTPEFVEFVKGSVYRQGLLQKAAMDDWSAADELFVAWEERQQSAQPASSPRQKAKAASLVKSGGSSAAGVVPRNDGKQIYSRSELIDMRIRNPDEFDARFQSEFLPAYLEGRVK